jgi:hypothetical protein
MDSFFILALESEIVVIPVSLSETALHPFCVLALLHSRHESLETVKDFLGNEARQAFRTVVGRCPVQHESFLVRFGKLSAFVQGQEFREPRDVFPQEGI